MRSKRQRRFEVRDLAELLGTNPRRIEGWVEQGLLKPAVRGRGPGRRRKFDEDNLIQGAVLLELQRTFGEKSPAWREGVPSAAKDVTRILRYESERDPPEGWYFMFLQRRGKRGRRGFAPPQIQAKFVRRGVPEGAALTIVNLTDVIRKIQSRLAKYEG